MLSRILLALLLATALPPAPLMAQAARNQPARSPDLQKFLNTPVWYLNYKMTLKASGTVTGDDGGSWSSTVDSVTSGTALLGVRSQGPSLSMIGGTVPLQGPQFFEIIDDYANWIGGIMPDESKTQEEQDAALLRVMEANMRAIERMSHQTEWTVPGVSAEASGPPGWDRYRVTKSGTAPVACLADFALEINAQQKTYKLKFASGFTDTEQSMTALRGESVDRVGAPDEFRQPIETSMISGSGIEITSYDPDPTIIDAPLPGSFGTLSGSPSYAVILGRGDRAIRGTLMIQYTISPTPSQPAELLIIPPNEYEDWRPLGARNEMESGDRIPIKVKLQKEGGGEPQFKAQRFIYRLVETSHEKGVCMNSPRIPAADNPFDLQFEADQNTDLDVIGRDRQQAEKVVDNATEDEVIVSSFDYGGYGEFEAIAELENGEVVYGVVRGTGEQRLKLPARNGDSHIAKVFLKALGNPPDHDDSENDPVGDGFKGDGLSLYEEYRGFMDGGLWTPGDPKKKDVFIYNQMRGMAQVQRGISVFEHATGLVVHRHILTKQVNGDMVINFHKNDATHVIDQHVIRIQAGRRGATSARVEKVGTPGTAKSVHMPPDWEEFRQRGNRMIPSFERTLAHEMSHDCNVYHHGEADYTVSWAYGENPDPVVIEMGPNGQAPITIKREDGSTISATQFFPPNTPVGNGYDDIKIGVPHGQHSGAEDCLMRYWIAYAYPSASDPSVRYLSPGEIRGTVLCATSAGTGINAPSHRPQSRYSTAATPANGGAWVSANRGKCGTQLRVNDLGVEPKR